MKTNLDRTKNIMFCLAVTFIMVLVVASFTPSAISLYDFALQLGFSRAWAICFPIFLDAPVLAAHFCALWFGLSGRNASHAMRLVWVTCALSIVANYLHAPTDGSLSFVVPGIDWQVYVSQIFGSLPPLLLVVTFSLIMRMVSCRIDDMTTGHTNDKAPVRHSQSGATQPTTNDGGNRATNHALNVTTNKPTVVAPMFVSDPPDNRVVEEMTKPVARKGNVVKSKPRRVATKKTTKRAKALAKRDKRRDEIAHLIMLGEDLDATKLARHYGVSGRTIQRDITEVAEQIVNDNDKAH